jgi:hypothetical protein
MLAMYTPRSCRAPFLAVLTCACAALAGCRHSLPVDHRVRGVVTYGGVPLREGRVTLLGDNGRIGAAVIQPDGTYEVVDPPLGKVRAGITTFPKLRPQPSQPLDLPRTKGLAFSVVPALAPARVPERYTDPERSDLRFVVTPGVQILDIHLVRGLADPPVVKADDIRKVGPAVGQQAPEIEGEDFDGKPFKLSDYRGRVVVVLFWGHW